MKKALSILAVLATVLSVKAADAEARSYSVTTDVTFASKYVWRGQVLASTSLQPSVEVAVQDLYFGSWVNVPVRQGDISEETDFYVGYGFTLAEGVTLDVGSTLYYYPTKSAGAHLTAPDRHDTYESYVGVKGEFSGFTPSFYAYYDWALDNLALQASLGYSVAIEQLGTSLDFSGYYGYSNGGPGKHNTYTYAGAGVTLPYKLAENAVLSGSVQYAYVDSRDLGKTGGSRSTWFYTISLTVGF
ncbi:MAG: TorF family putative porin [Opitutaceae bacterium]|nr:TorF family putative porin [Opitutaceae bacterium]